MYFHDIFQILDPTGSIVFKNKTNEKLTMTSIYVSKWLESFIKKSHSIHENRKVSQNVCLCFQKEILKHFFSWRMLKIKSHRSSDICKRVAYTKANIFKFKLKRGFSDKFSPKNFVFWKCFPK